MSKPSGMGVAVRGTGYSYRGKKTTPAACRTSVSRQWWPT